MTTTSYREHENGSKGVLAADVVTRKSIRHIDVYGRPSRCLGMVLLIHTGVLAKARKCRQFNLMHHSTLKDMQLSLQKILTVKS